MKAKKPKKPRLMYLIYSSEEKVIKIKDTIPYQKFLDDSQ